MKRTILLACLILLPLAVGAQNHQAQAQAPGPDGPRDAMRMVAEYLALTPEQGDAWRGLMETLKGQQQPLADQVRAFEEELRLAIQAPEPDPVLVGTLVLEIHSLRDEMRLNEEAYRDAFEDLLTDEQLERLFILREASKLAPLFPAFHDTRLL